MPFDGRLADNINDLKQRIANKKASLMIVDGGVGEGKTTLAVHVAEYFQGRPLDFKKQLALGGEQFQEKLQDALELGIEVIIYDEAGDFNRRGALTKFNQQLNRVFETYRAFRTLVILVLPCFDVLDTPLFLKQIPRLLLHCYNRGNTYGSYGGYSLYSMYYLKRKMKEITVTPQAYKLVDPNFWGQFYDLSPVRSDELENISLEGKREVLSKGVLAHRGLVNAETIGKEINRSQKWISLKFKEHNIKPEMIHKKVKYFDHKHILMLQEEKMRK